MITINAYDYDSVSDASLLASSRAPGVNTADLFERCFFKLHSQVGMRVINLSLDLSALLAGFLLATSESGTVKIDNLSPAVCHVYPVLTELVVGKDHIAIFEIGGDSVIIANVGSWNTASRYLLKCRKFNPVLINSRACYDVTRYGISRYFVDHNRI